MANYATVVAFERHSICALCFSQALYNRLGEHIDPQLLNDPLASLLLRALRSVCSGTGGRVPGPHIILQEIRFWVDDGKVKLEDFQLVEEMLFCTEPDGDDEAYVNSWTPHLQIHALKAIAQKGIDSYKSGEVSALPGMVDAIDRTARIGKATNSSGITLDTGLDEALAAMQLEAVTTGVPDLDILLQGGMLMGTLTMYLGGPNSGKSMELTTCAAANVLAGLNVAVATLENSRAVQMGRIISAMVGIPTTALSNSRPQIEQALSSSVHGELVVEYFAPIATRIRDIRTWVRDRERELGKRFQVIIIDYTDKVSSHIQGQSEYEGQRVVCETFRDWVAEEKRWGVTATQSVRKQRGAPEELVLDEADVADSQHKIRVVDVMISLNPRGPMYYWWIIRHRLIDCAKRGVEAPHDRHICRTGRW